MGHDIIEGKRDFGFLRGALQARKPDGGASASVAIGVSPASVLFTRRRLSWMAFNALVAVPLAYSVSLYVLPPHHYFWYGVIIGAVVLLPWISWEDNEN
jgi:hypothetical protein